MGCRNSKEKKSSDSNYYSSTVPKRYSKHVVHSRQSTHDNNHDVKIKSTTFGSMDEFSNANKVSESDTFKTQNVPAEANNVCSNLIEQKLEKDTIVPNSSIITTTCEVETINTWELMEGLEDTTDPLGSPIHLRSFSFDISSNSNNVAIEIDPYRSCRFIENNSPSLFKPLWLQDESISNLKPNVDDHVISSLLHNGNNDDVSDMDFKANDNVVVFYFTSLRSVRKTFEDCCDVKAILKGLRVKIDERDVWMDSGFKEELKELLGDEFGKGALLPRVFIGRNYIGGIDEIRKLDEEGKLKKIFDCCEKIDDNDDVCEACGNMKFVLCETCNGSCKIHFEEQEVGQDCEVGQHGFLRCPHCNEIGLIRCPKCCHHCHHCPV